MKKQELAQEVFDRLKKLYPDAHCELNHSNAFELLIATILSAQCTDARVNMVTPDLFKKYPTPQKLAKAKLEECTNPISEAMRSGAEGRARMKLGERQCQSCCVIQVSGQQVGSLSQNGGHLCGSR